MKKLFILPVILLLSAFGSNAQMFWTENFENGLTSDGTGVAAYTTGPNGPWTLAVTGTEDKSPNLWFVSCAENGHTAGVCGTACVGVSPTATLATLHIGSAFKAGGDNGASYFSGGFCFGSSSSSSSSSSP
ncbi:MAG: hypothetical protein JWQ38_1277, partial [Flavipsychrobacter sp.]|nr:hypothetical protein [Flavipsychrobacter sp.]